MKKDFEEIKAKKIPFGKYDFIILGVVLVLLVVVLVISFTGNSASVCKIYRDGKCIKVVNLSDFSDGLSFGGDKISSKVFEFNGVRITVFKDGAEVTHAECYDEACVKARKITKKGQCIECTASRIAVTLA